MCVDWVQVELYCGVGTVVIVVHETSDECVHSEGQRIGLCWVTVHSAVCVVLLQLDYSLVNKCGRIVMPTQLLFFSSLHFGLNLHMSTTTYSKLY